MRRVNYTPYPRLAPSPVTYGMVRCWLPGYGTSPRRAISNLCASMQGSNDSSDGATLILGTGTNVTAGDGPVVLQGSNNGWPYLSFDGSNDSARCRYAANPVIPEIESATYATIALGFRRTAVSAVSMQFGFSETNSVLFRIRAHSDGNVYFDLSGGSGRSGSFACNDLNWHLLVFTYDGSQGTDAGKVQGYLDGTPMTLTFAGTLPSTIDINGSCWMGFDDTSNTSVAGDVNFAALWGGRHLEKSDVHWLTEEWRLGYPRFLLNSTNRRAALVYVPADTYTGTATLQTQIATLAASGTRTTPTYTGSGTLTTQISTLAGTGTHTPPTYTATPTLATDATTLAGTGTHTAPTYTGSGSLAPDAATLTTTGAYTPPLITGTATLLTDAATLATTGTHTAPTYTGAGDLEAVAATLSATGLMAGYIGTANLTTDAATLAGTGTHTAPVYTGSAALTSPITTVSATGIHTAPTYTGSGNLAAQEVLLTATGAHTAPVYTGSGTLASEAGTLVGTGTHTAPVYTGSGTLAVDVLMVSASGTVMAPVYTGSGALVTEVTTLSGAGTHTAPVYLGSAALFSPDATVSGSGLFTAPIYTGEAVFFTDAAILVALGVSDDGRIHANSELTWRAVVQAGTWSATTIINMGTWADMVLSHLTWLTDTHAATWANLTPTATWRNRSL